MWTALHASAKGGRERRGPGLHHEGRRWTLRACCGEVPPEVDVSGLPGQCSFTDTSLSALSWASSFFPNRNLPIWGLYSLFSCITS